MGEAYMKNGQKELAIENYEKSIALNPNNEGGKDMLKKLKSQWLISIAMIRLQKIKIGGKEQFKVIGKLEKQGLFSRFTTLFTQYATQWLYIHPLPV